MNLEVISWQVGRFIGRRLLPIPLAWFRRRAAEFEMTVHGDDHLLFLPRDASFLIVSNHIAAGRSELWPLAHLPYFRQYHHSTDSFIFDRITSERTGRPIQTVAICGAAWLSPRALRRYVQLRIGQPLARGQMEVMQGYIGVEKQPGAYQRRFLSVVDQTVRNHDPILIFPIVGGSLDMGAAHIARRHKLMILPACIIGSESWRAGNKVTVAFGNAFSTDGMSKDEINAQVSDRIQSLLAVYEPVHAAHSANKIAEHAPAAMA